MAEISVQQGACVEIGDLKAACLLPDGSHPLYAHLAPQAAQADDPEWVDDPHDIEQGMMRNPKYRAPVAAQPAQDERESFEAWAQREGLIVSSHGVTSVNSMCDLARKAFDAGRAALSTKPAVKKNCPPPSWMFPDDVAQDASKPAQDEQEAFEAWAQTQKDTWLIVGGLTWSPNTNDYASPRTNAAWAAWQARAALGTPPMEGDALDAKRYRVFRDRKPVESFITERGVRIILCDWARNLDPDAMFNMWSQVEINGEEIDREADAAIAAMGKGQP